MSKLIRSLVLIYAAVSALSACAVFYLNFAASPKGDVRLGLFNTVVLVSLVIVSGSASFFLHKLSRSEALRRD